MPVRIAAFSSLSHAWLPNAIKEFQQRNPSVSFEIRISTNEITTWLQQGEVDIALADAQRCEGFQWQPLMDDMIRYIEEESHPIWFLWGKEAQKYNFVQRSYQSRHPMLCSANWEDDFLKNPCFRETADRIDWLG